MQKETPLEITVKSYAMLKERLGGHGELVLQVADGATVRELIGMLGDKYGRDVTALILTPDGDLDPGVVVSHNGKVLTSANDSLSNGDLVLFLSPMPGG